MSRAAHEQAAAPLLALDGDARRATLVLTRVTDGSDRNEHGQVHIDDGVDDELSVDVAISGGFNALDQDDAKAALDQDDAKAALDQDDAKAALEEDDANAALDEDDAEAALDEDDASEALDDADPQSIPEPPPESLPLARLVALLPDDGETDARWGARRHGERIPFARPIALSKLEAIDADGTPRVKVETTFDGWSINVCHGGMRIVTERTLVRDDRILVEVTSSGSTYLGEARVCWVRAEADGVIAGLEFLQQR